MNYATTCDHCHASLIGEPKPDGGGPMNIIETIEQQIRTDEEDTTEKSRLLLTLWSTATPKERALIDRVFITLCGWSLTTLIAPPWLNTPGASCEH